MSLLSLLGLQGAADDERLPPIRSPFDEKIPDPVDITVAGKRTPPPQYEAPTYRMGNEDVPQYQDIQQAPPDTTPFPRTSASPQELAGQNAYDNLPEHKGMFGLKGTLRDILGTLGDALLVGNGQKEQYAPMRDQEKMSDAMTGFGTASPEMQATIINRVSALNPEAGLKLQEQLQRQQYQQGQLGVQQEKAKQDQAEYGDKRMKNARDYAARLLNSVKDPSQLPYAFELIKKTTGMSPEEIGLSAGMSPEQTALYSRGDMTVNQQENRELGGRRVDQGDRRLDLTERQGDTRNAIAQQNAAANTKRANRPPAGRAPHTPTDSERFISLSDKDPSQLSRGEAAWLKSKSKKQSVRDRFGLGDDKPATGGKLVFRNGKLVPK